MPAVQLSRLKEQIAQLAWHFTRPAEFQTGLGALLDTYSDRTYRPGQAVKSRPLSPAYHVAPLVLRQLEQEMGRLCQENPGASLSLADALWQDPYLETRMLAASLLGQTPLDPPEPVLERLLAWSSPELDVQVIEALMRQGSARLRREMPDRWLVLVERWLSEPDIEFQSLGAKALLPMIQDREYENLPRVYRLLGPLLQSAPNPLQSELSQDIEALARRSPAETVYFLRQMISIGCTPTTIRIVRHCLPIFPEEGQLSLRKALVSRRETPDS